MRSGITEVNETDAQRAIRAIRHDEPQKAAVLFSARMHSVTSPPFQPNNPEMAGMDSNETCACCGKELVSGRCLRCGTCERCGT
jgi:hypothetical protein